MTEWLGKLFDIGKLPSKVVALVAAVSGALLFVPDDLQEPLQTRSLVTHHGAWVGLAFVASAGLLSLNCVLWAGARVTRARRRWRFRARLLSESGRLDPAESAVLREFYLQQRDTLMLPVDEPSVAGLLNKGVLSTVGSMGRHTGAGVLWPVSIHEDLRGIEPSRFGLPADPTQQDIDRVVSARPAFMRRIAEVEAWRYQ